MNHKSRIKMLTDYVLSQDHERDTLIENIDNDLTHSERRTYIEESIWYSAMVLAYGRAEARKEVTELLKEIKCN